MTEKEFQDAAKRKRFTIAYFEDLAASVRFVGDAIYFLTDSDTGEELSDETLDNYYS